MAEIVGYVLFDDDERRLLQEVASFVVSGGDEDAALINSVTHSREPMSLGRLVKLYHAINSAAIRQREYITATTEAGHENLVPTYEQNIKQRLQPAAVIVENAIRLARANYGGGKE